MQASTFCQRRLEPMEHTARRTRVRVQRYRLANRLDLVPKVRSLLPTTRQGPGTFVSASGGSRKSV